MSSRAPTPADGSPPNAGAGSQEAVASLASPLASPSIAAPVSPAARLRAFAHGCAGLLRAAVRHPVWRGLGRTLLRLALALLALALVAGLLIRFVLWPQASAARQWLEDRGSLALSAKLTIDSLDTYWNGWHPAFRAHGVKVVDAQQRTLISAGSLDGQLAWRSLFSMNLQFGTLSAAQADVLVRRTPEGKLLVAGMAVDTAGGNSDDNRFLDWLMTQGQMDLTDGKLRWLDEKGHLPQLDVAQIHFSARRMGQHHEISLEAQSEALAPRPLVMRANLRHDYLRSAGNWRHWSGQASWDVTQLQLPVVQRYLTVFERVTGGSFSTDGSVEFSGGRIVRSQARLRGSGIDLQLAGASEALQLANAQAFLLHRSDRDGNNLLTIDTLLWQPQPAAGPPSANDTAWREGMRKVTLGWSMDNKGELRKFSLKAPTFDLNTVRALATSMPVDTAVLRQLRALQPAGHIDNLNVSWNRDRQGMLERRPGKAHYAVQGTLRNVSVNGQPAVPALGANGKPNLGVPGFANLSGTFSFDDRQGAVHFEGANSALVLPGMFDEPRLPFDQIGGDLRWTRQDGHMTVTVDNIRFANADTAGNVSGSWRTGGDSTAGIADLSGELSRAQVARVPRYLPLGIPAGTRHYLAGALAGGEAAGVRFVLKGDLTHFPFHAPFEKAGDFRVEVPIRQVRYQIAAHETGAGGAPLWPAFADIDGQVLFERGGMSFLARRATVHGIAGVTLQDVSGRIDDLSDHGRLEIDGGASGAVQGFLQYMAASPVREWTGHVVDNARAQGNGELRLKLDMPLTNANATRVDGTFRFPGNDVVLNAQVPQLGGASGIIAFNEHGFQLANMRARFLGGEVRIGGGSQPDGSVRVSANGNATAAGLREAAAGSAAAALAARLEGGTGYGAVFSARERQTQVQVSSDLNGMAIGLPPPLAKPAAQDMPLRFELRPAQGRTGLDEMLVQLGGALNARYLLRHDRNGGDTEVVAGAIGLQQAAPLPASGVTAAATLDQFDVDDWRSALASLGSLQGDGSRRASPPAFLPERIHARMRTLKAAGRTLDDVTVDAAREAGGWDVNLDSRQIAGNMQWRAEGPSGSGAMRLRLSRLNVPDASDEHNVVDAIADSIDTLPSIDLVAEQFTLRGHDFGKLEVVARSSKSGNEPVWTLERLLIEQPGATLTGSGTWRVPRRLRDGDAANAPRRTALTFAIEIRDAGATLERLGLPHTLRDGKGKLEGRVAWRGSPMSIDYPTLGGRLSLELENGQILSVEPGAARLLGVLSLQGLLRFASLDFRTLSGRGLLFDRISGSGTIENGVGSIQDFELKSPQIIASMSGSANLLRETQDLDVQVIPRISATTTSVAAAFINPVLGIGTLAAQLLFADEFSRVFTQHYRITGSWANPQIGKVGDNKAQHPTYQNRTEPALSP
ncbi:YhdP family protein [Cupriavidus sp. WKF15]|uniref:YhdP family protein n=1 Tax=Cupriavidus sp. WKF15 TaxID=3032282 RepID=UPI0023E342BA|nr:YhdP family protein [Cupriavidus sp. WKF15]WER44822.1 YhdP family protein [Cupriavidus sp. WKF15]